MRLTALPRKAKCLERKSTAHFRFTARLRKAKRLERKSTAHFRFTARLWKENRLERKSLPPVKTKKEDKLDLSNLSSV